MGEVGGREGEVSVRVCIWMLCAYIPIARKISLTFIAVLAEVSMNSKLFS